MLIILVCIILKIGIKISSPQEITDNKARNIQGNLPSLSANRRTNNPVKVVKKRLEDINLEFDISCTVVKYVPPDFLDQIKNDPNIASLIIWDGVLTVN